jgi:aspartate carbamoyltransferase catalytic subunit
MFNPQLNRRGELQHLLSTEGLPRSIVMHILDRACSFLPAAASGCAPLPVLADRRVCLAFGAASARSRIGFALAARQLSAGVFDLDGEASQQTNREGITACPGDVPRSGSLLERIGTLTAAKADLLVLQHRSSGAAHFAARHVAPQVRIINAGDGMHADPVQALIHVLNILQHKPDLTALSMAIVGDIAHSGLARSLIHVFTTLGVPELRVIAPHTLLPSGIEQLGVRVFTDMHAGVAGVDVIIMLPEPDTCEPSLRESLSLYEVTPDEPVQANANAIVLRTDPGLSGIAITAHLFASHSAAMHLCDSAAAVVIQPDALAVATRMAVMSVVAAVPA